MGIFDKLFGKSGSLREEWASDKNLTCARCGKKPLLKKDDVMPETITRSSSSLFDTFPKHSDTIYWKGKKYTLKKLQKSINETVYDRAVKCTECGQIFCAGCVNEYGSTLPTGYKGCPYCGSTMEILGNEDEYAHKNAAEGLGENIRENFGKTPGEEIHKPQEFPHYDDKKHEEIKRINRENWERAQRIKDQRKRRESLELDKKQEDKRIVFDTNVFLKRESPELNKKQKDPVQMCWKFLDEYNEKMDAIWNGGRSLEDKSLEKLEKKFIQCIEELNHSDMSIAVLEAILSPQNMKVWSGIHTAAQRKRKEFLSSEERVENEDREETKTKKDVEGLINALKDEDADVRWEAARALDEMGLVPKNRTEGG